MMLGGGGLAAAYRQNVQTYTHSEVKLSPQMRY